MLRFTLCFAVLCFGTSLWAQSKPATAPDPQALIAKLTTKSTRSSALEELKTMPASAIIPLLEAANDASRPQATRDDLLAAIDAIATRVRTAAAAEDNRALLAWNSNTSVKFYEQSWANPKWDAAVHKGFSDFDRHTFSAALDSFTAAVNAGCTDPLVAFDRDYLAVVMAQGDRAPLIATLCRSFQDFETSTYPNSRRCAVEASFALLAGEPQGRESIPESLAQSSLRRGIAHYKDLAAEHPGRAQLRLIACNLYLADAKLGISKEDSKDVIDAISAALPADALSYFFKANFYLEWAWEARGSGFANTVTEEHGRLFEERLVQARQVAEAGWRLNPVDPDCPTVMITVCMGLGLGRREMESWYARAMVADPHNFTACMAKEQFLLPKWGGSVEEELEFGRYCVAHGDAQDRLPTVLIQAYKDLVEFTPGANPLVSTPQFWPDVRSAYTKLLADKSRLQTHRDEYLADRGAYVKAACDTQHWKEANALMKEFGKDIDVAAIGGQALYDYYQRKAAAAEGTAP